MATAQITPDQDAILAEVFIAAPPARVFEAIADPKQLTDWWGKKGVFKVVESKYDLRPGGKWSYQGVGPNNAPFHMEGEYLEIDPPRTLEYTWIANWHLDKKLRTVVRWELTPTKSGTNVKVTHSGLATEAVARADYRGGWPGVVAHLKAFVEQAN